MGRSVTEVEAAQRRATASAFLRNNPGPQTAKAVGAHIGIGTRSASQILRHLSETGLIGPPVGSAGNKRYAWKDGESAPAPAAPAAAPVATRPPPVAAPARTERVPIMGVELLVGGAMVIVGPGERVIVGRNEQTGRMRIMLEDMP